MGEDKPLEIEGVPAVLRIAAALFRWWPTTSW